jgi:hypothetical protein
MNQKPTGSPIIAREFFPFVKYFLLIIFILAVIVLVWYIFLKFSKYKETPEYLEKKKKKRPSTKEISIFCSKFNFSKEQRKVFTYIAKNLKNENLIYSIKDNVRLNEIFNEFYKKLSLERNDKKIYALFSLLFKIEQINSHKAKIKNLEPPKNNIPKDILEDYLKTRKRNFEINKLYLNLAQEGFFDTLIFSKDDCAEFGLNVEEANFLEKEIQDKNIKNAKTKTGADEIPLSLLSKALTNQNSIKIKPVFLNDKSTNLISKYEDISIKN